MTFQGFQIFRCELRVIFIPLSEKFTYNIIKELIEKKASEIMARIDNQIQSTWSGLGKVKKKGLIARWRSAAPDICNNVLKSDRIPTKIV